MALMRFYLDEDLSDKIAAIARSAGIDVVSSHETGRNRLTDEEQLLQAATDGRCLVTRNYKDFVRLTTIFLEHEWPHAGVLGVPRSLANHDFAGIAHAIVAYAGRVTGDLPAYTTDFLSPASRR